MVILSSEAVVLLQMVMKTTASSRVAKCPDAVLLLNASANWTIVGALALATAATKLVLLALIPTRQCGQQLSRRTNLNKPNN